MLEDEPHEAVVWVHHLAIPEEHEDARPPDLLAGQVLATISSAAFATCSGVPSRRNKRHEVAHQAFPGLNLALHRRDTHIFAQVDRVLRQGKSFLCGRP